MNLSAVSSATSCQRASIAFVTTDFWPSLPAQKTLRERASRRHQNRHLMITATRLRQRRADLPSPWSSTGCDDTHSNAPCQQQNEPARATLGGYPNYQDLPLPPTRCVIARPSAHCDPSNAPSSS